jgi:uncharacterized protein YuzE
MKIKYFRDTDTLYIELKAGDIAETRDLDENTQLDVDRSGNIRAITIEHAKDRPTSKSGPDGLPRPRVAASGRIIAR